MPSSKLASLRNNSFNPLAVSKKCPMLDMVKKKVEKEEKVYL